MLTDTAPMVRSLHVQPTHGHNSQQKYISVPGQGQQRRSIQRLVRQLLAICLPLLWNQQLSPQEQTEEVLNQRTPVDQTSGPSSQCIT